MEDWKYVGLTDSELMLLDGECSDRAQAEVDKAKHRLDALGKYIGRVGLEAAYLIGDVVHAALTSGKLAYKARKIRECDLCGALDKYGIDLEDSCLHFEGRANIGCCEECMEDIKPCLKNALKGVVAELPEQIMGVQKYRREHLMKCSRCNWEGHRGEMKLGKAFLTDDLYPKHCPSCPATNSFLNTQIRRQDGYAVVYARSGRVVPT